MKHKLPKPVTVDFETLAIQGRPDYPPLPVGVSIKYAGKPSRYYAWGHTSGNNATWDEAMEALRRAWMHKEGVCFQNGKFDVDVAETHCGLPRLPWDKVHDTLFLLFLDDPHQIELGLKPSAERLLSLPPEEQDAVGEWLMGKQPIKGARISKSRNSERYFGAYLAFAPGGLVGTYANGDVDRTEALFKLLWPKTAERKMLGAYDRERKLMPILLDMERRGVPVDAQRLGDDIQTYTRWQIEIDAWVKKTIKAPKDINLDSGGQLMEALIASGKADESLIPLTPTGKYQTTKDALLAGVIDKTLIAMLKYRTQLNTCLNTFMIPWYEVAKVTGCIFTTWNQTKTPSGSESVGTRTGRLSSTPNFQNMPKEFTPIFFDEAPKLKLPKCPLKGLPSLPLVRSYITPFAGHAFIDRDYSQQEPRILAHFDGGELLETYQKNPWVDFHDHSKERLDAVGKHYDRKRVKTTNLGLIYGMGVGKLAEKNELSVEEAQGLKKAILALYPGLRDMYTDMKTRAKNNLPIRTWGGREYYCEPSRMIDGRLVMFDYKLVNILIQGSAADCTKEAIIRTHEKLLSVGKQNDWFILLNVHDQITMSVPHAVVSDAMKLLRECMESIEFDVPMLSEGSTSTTNWAELKDYDKKGALVLN